MSAPIAKAVETAIPWPSCEEDTEPCSDAAEWALRIAHYVQCEPQLFLLCERHARLTRDSAASAALHMNVHVPCGLIVTNVDQLVVSEFPL